MIALATILGLALGMVKSLACLYDPARPRAPPSWAD
jgi:hypothetical protein